MKGKCFLLMYFIFIFRMGDLNFVGLLRLTWVLMLARWFSSSFSAFVIWLHMLSSSSFLNIWFIWLCPWWCFGINLKSAHSCFTFVIPSFWKSLHLMHVIWFRGYVYRKWSYSFFFFFLTLLKFILMKYALITIPTTASLGRERWNHWACKHHIAQVNWKERGFTFPNINPEWDLSLENRLH